MNEDYSNRIEDYMNQVEENSKEVIDMVLKEIKEDDSNGHEDSVGMDTKLDDSSREEDSTVKDSLNINKSERIMFRMNSSIANALAQGFAYEKWNPYFLKGIVKDIEDFHDSEDFKQFNLNEVRTEVLQLLGFKKFGETFLAVPLWFFILMPKDKKFLSCSGFYPYGKMKMTPISAIDPGKGAGCTFAFVERDDIQ